MKILKIGGSCLLWLIIISIGSGFLFPNLTLRLLFCFCAGLINGGIHATWYLK